MVDACRHAVTLLDLTSVPVRMVISYPMIIAHVLVCIVLYIMHHISLPINHSDVEECLIDTHNCSQLCVELDGGFKCDCSDGYELGNDGITCEGKR